MSTTTPPPPPPPATTIHVDEAIDLTCPDTLKTFITKRIFDSLSNWNLDENNRVYTSEQITTNLILQTNTKKNVKEFRKSILDRGMSLSHILSTSKIQNLDLLKDESLEIIMTNYYKDRDKNIEMFQQITDHHNTLAETIEDWVKDEELVQKSNLDIYASAATEMGEKEWVRHGNLWMQYQIIEQFRLGKAKKDFMKQFKATYHYSCSAPKLSAKQIDVLALSLPSDLFGSYIQANTLTSNNVDLENVEMLHALVSSKSDPIKVVDVGSCYNPFASGPYRDLLEVVALDLRPTDTSVHQCDFLRLQFGPNDSAPLFAHSSSSLAASSSLSDGTTRKMLIQLPEHQYHAVTMSLVLCYLPTPEARLAMIRQARKLLIHTESDDEAMLSDYDKVKTWRPHHRGLLVIFEKQSIMPVSKNVELFMNHWKDAICSEGFEFVRHERVLNDRHRSHGFVFRTASYKVKENMDSINNTDIQLVAESDQNNFINTAITTTTNKEIHSVLDESAQSSTPGPFEFVPLLTKDGLYIKNDFLRKRDIEFDENSTNGSKRQAL